MTTKKKGAESVPYIAYYRVSTKEQGKSGLGLEAQRAGVRAHLQAVCGDLAGEFTEVESGRKRNRPQLAAALAACKRNRARLIIARLDRLARNVAFVSSLMESRVDFVAADNPHASPFMVHVISAMAEEEARLTSERIKSALKAAKERGVRLGAMGEVRARENIAAADAFAEKMAPIIQGLYEEGITTERAICAELNARNIPTPRGGVWHNRTVGRLLHRIQDIT